MTADDELFVSDNQGEQNVFNELNHIVEGARTRSSREDPQDKTPASTPAIQIPIPGRAASTAFSSSGRCETGGGPGRAASFRRAWDRVRV